jgi:hypothetical protein
MKFPWKRQAILTQSRSVSTKQLELDTAKAILGEIFRIRPADVDDMIQQRLVERNCLDRHEDGLWPATFSFGE